MILFSETTETTGINFQQPYLAIIFRNGHAWYIDVAGKIDVFLKNYTAVKVAYEKMPDEEKRSRGIPTMPDNAYGSGSDWRSQATPLLERLIRELAGLGLAAKQIFGYEGSGEANYVIRGGILFSQANAEDIDKEPGKEEVPDIDVARWIPELLKR